MYAVVGCSNCSALWVVEDHPETTRCPRCGTRRRYDALKKFHTAESADAAKQARAAMLAERSGHGDAFANLEDYGEMDRRLDEAGVGDDEYLAGSGLDPDAVRDAAESDDGPARSHPETVRAAVEELDAPTADAVVAYAVDRGVPAAKARTVLDRLVDAGEATERDGTYRLL
ncbi:MAG: DUF5817 domain-containing protein [Halobacteriaceae archaeon]